MIILKYLLLLSVVLLAVRLLFQPAKPVTNTHLTEQKLCALFEALLYQGADGASLSIYTKDERLSLHFVKYVRRKGRSGFMCEIPIDPWAHLTVDSIRQDLTARGLRFSETNNRTLQVDLEQNLAKAIGITELLFAQASGVRLSDDCLARLDEKVLGADLPWLTGVRRPGT
jgi:uncharacterized lipoprotein YajG